MTTPEQWPPIPNFEGLYALSPEGVRSLDRQVEQRSRWGHPVATTHRGRLLTPYRCSNGRLRVVLHDRAHRRHLKFVDKLVDDVFGEQI